jgi:hypothetical protein
MRPSATRRQVPLIPEEVNGWRSWSVVERYGDVRLASITRAESWEPSEPFTASCERRRHEAPGRACSCGVYAASHPEELARLRRIAGAAVGEVSLWGSFRCVTSTRVTGPCRPPDRSSRACYPRIGWNCCRADRARHLLAASVVAFLVVLALLGAVARLRSDGVTADVPTADSDRPIEAIDAVEDEIVQLPYHRTDEGLIFTPRIRALLLTPERLAAPRCGRLVIDGVEPAECNDQLADVSVEGVGPADSDPDRICSSEAVVATRTDDRVLCWRRLPPDVLPEPEGS